MDQTRWRKATRSDGANNCVEIHPDGWVRDSKDPHHRPLAVNLHALLSAIHTNRLTR